MTSSGGAPSRDPGKVPSGADGNENVEIYRIAYDEAKRGLDDQTQELTDIRQRCVQFMALVTSATGFLVGARLATGNRDTAFGLMAGVSSGLSLLSVAACVLVLLPWFIKWSARISPKKVIQAEIEQHLAQQVPPATESELLDNLATFYEKHMDTNDESLARVRWAYLACVASGAVGLVLWTLTAWVT